jgi:hypothetical protein
MKTEPKKPAVRLTVRFRTLAKHLSVLEDVLRKVQSS